jgi:4-hydroxybenzoate polyprenyltransferase
MNDDGDWARLAYRIPAVLFFNWMNLLIFDLANQRHPESIQEDLLNKPWRPLPAGRITSIQTTVLMLISIPYVLMVGMALNTLSETCFILILTWMYNDLGGADFNWIVRNCIIAVAFGFFNAGSLKLSVPTEAEINYTGWQWTFIISAVILTTMHTQDLKDQTGDRSRGRNTAPIALGDGPARWSLSIPIFIWSFVCPSFWSSNWMGFVPSVVFGVYVSWRILRKRNKDDDRTSWKLWCLWTIFLYALPLSSRLLTA